MISQPPPIEVTPVILCGGSGTRLWPLSRTGFPKQFLCLTGTTSLFQQAAQRLVQLGEPGRDPGGDMGLAVGKPLIVSGEEHRFLVLEQLREVGCTPQQALLEPVGRNTAPALTLAALAACADGADPILVVTPADQTIADGAAFHHAMQCACREASHGSIVVLGVVPTRPETGYGYIQSAAASSDNAAANSACASNAPAGGMADHAALGGAKAAAPAGPRREAALPVRRFVEKPDAATAQAYLESGNYYWNAGMFVLRASRWLEAMEQFRPDILHATRAAWECRRVDASFVRPGADEFAAIPAESVDYAVLERCHGHHEREHKYNHGHDHKPEHEHSQGHGSQFALKMVPLDAGWNDLGAWDAVWQTLAKDQNGNAHCGDVISSDSRDTLVHATSRLVGLVGVKNLIVVETPDAVLVANKERSQEVKAIVNALNQRARGELALHRKVHRPWGWYDSIDEGSRFKVKRIQVKPKASLSLQMHHHRAEHWIVVRGTAEITNGTKTILLTENQSTYIPLGESHRLSNPGTIPLEIIEVQSGSYLGEDDIVRFEDSYGRA